MNILVVCSGNAPNFDFQKHQAFIYDQIEAIVKVDSSIQFDYFFIKKKGVWGYLSSIKQLKEKLKTADYDCIHAHFAVSALVANLQRQVPVITTFHGSDINLIVFRWISLIVAFLNTELIYVSSELFKKAFLKFQHKSHVIPCGVDFEVFYPQDKIQSRLKMKLQLDKKYILFSSDFKTRIKNPDLALQALNVLADPEIHLLELTNYTRNEVAVLLNAVDVALMTSFSEGSPQFIKEALACNCPVVSTDVGDVSDNIKEIQGCFITTYQAKDVAEKLKKALEQPKLLNGRDHIKHLDNAFIANKVLQIYLSINSK